VILFDVPGRQVHTSSNAEKSAPFADYTDEVALDGIFEGTTD
jgi:hypothetical protein